MQPTRAPQQARPGVRYCTVYVHYLTGKIMRASDYGYKAWPFGRGG